ncbi:MAG: YwqG family protein [Planctomycetota bacterium]
MNKQALRQVWADSELSDVWATIDRNAPEAVVMRPVPSGLDAPISELELDLMKRAFGGQTHGIDWENMDPEVARRWRAGMPFIGTVSWSSRSQFGGLPELPTDFEWPMGSEDYLEFVAQIDLSELPEFEGRELLPSSGVLAFFLDVACDWGEFDLPVACHYFADPGVLRRVGRHPRVRDPFDVEVWARDSGADLLDPDTQAIPPARLAMQPVVSIPGVNERMGWEGGDHSRQQLFDALEDIPDDRLDELSDWLLDNGPTPDLQLLGEPNPIQGAVLDANSGERLLLQISTVDPYTWGDEGRVYIIAKLEDLHNHRFDGVRATWDGG